MPPTNQNNPNSEYDFILKGDQQPQQQQPSASGKFFLPKKAIFLAVGGVLILMIGLIVFSSLSKDEGPTKEIVAALGTNQEIARVSDLVAEQSKDAATLNLAATTSTTLASQQSELALYAAKHSIKYKPVQLLPYKDKNIDTALEAAAQNNSTEEVYYEFLKTELAKYQATLQELSNIKSKSLTPVLQKAYTSNATLLKSPLLSS